MSKFGEAFKSARKAGKKNFKFNGKSYTTKTKEEAAAPVPKSRPKKAKAPVKGLNLPSAANAKASAASQKLKGPVPKKNKVGVTKGGNTGDKTKKGANQIATYVKRKKQLGV
jgi:hypothetical protein